MQTQRDIIAIPKTINKIRMIENKDIFDFKLTEEDIFTICSLEKEGINQGRGCQFSSAKMHKYYPFHTEF